jgi:hypothetical protein
VRGVAWSAFAYALGSGWLVNPTGFRKRIAHLLGPASAPWMRYPSGLHGAIALTRDALRTTPDFTSWLLVGAAIVGLAAVFVRPGRLEQVRLLLPLVASASFALLFSLPVRVYAHRYFLPESVFLLPYAALAFDTVWQRWTQARILIALAAAAAVAPAVLGVASMDATLLADPRYAAERRLAQLPAGAHVEVYGGPIFLPRIPLKLVAIRPGVEPIATRQAIANVTDIVDPDMDPRPRAPDAIVLGTELSDLTAALPAPWAIPPAPMQYEDERSQAFLHALFAGELGYVRAVRATCEVPWPLQCRSVHHSTAREVWIYERARFP